MKVLWFLVVALSCASFAQNGAAIYQQHCAACHDVPKGRIPPVESLRKMSDAAILRALESGTMREQARDLNTQERQAVAAYLSSREAKATSTITQPGSGSCKSAAPADVTGGYGWNGFGSGLTNTRFQRKDAAGLAITDVPKLRLKWALNLGDVTVARGQPVIVGGRLFATTVAGKVYALDAKSGCIYWIFDADAGVRSGVIVNTA